MKVRINREDYQLIRKDLGPNFDGFCHTDTKTLEVSKRFKNQRETLEALFHEMVHAECEESGIRQTVGWTLDKEEMLCEIISRSFALNLPEIMKFLRKK